MDGLVTQAQYARHRGVTRQAVSKMVQAGRIPTHGRQRLIDPAEADVALEDTNARLRPADNLRLLEMPSVGVGSLTKMRTALTGFEARRAELRLRKEMGQLLEVEDVTRSMQACGAVIVRAIDDLPNHADRLATAFTRAGVDAVRRELKDIARSVRETLAENMRVVKQDEK